MFCTGEERHQAPVQAGCYPAGKKLCEKEPEAPGGHQVDHEPSWAIPGGVLPTG